MGKVNSPRGGTTRGLSSDILDRDRGSVLYSPSYPGLSTKRAKTKREGHARSLWKNPSSAIKEGRENSGDLAGKTATALFPPAVDPAQLRASGGLREESSDSEIEVREEADKKEEKRETPDK